MGDREGRAKKSSSINSRGGDPPLQTPSNLGLRVGSRAVWGRSSFCNSAASQNQGGGGDGEKDTHLPTLFRIILLLLFFFYFFLFHVFFLCLSVSILNVTTLSLIFVFLHAFYMLFYFAHLIFCIFCHKEIWNSFLFVFAFYHILNSNRSPQSENKI